MGFTPMRSYLVDFLRDFPSEVWEIRESDSGEACFAWTRLSPRCYPIRADSRLFVRFDKISDDTHCLWNRNGLSDTPSGIKSTTEGVAGVERH